MGYNSLRKAKIYKLRNKTKSWRSRIMPVFAVVMLLASLSFPGLIPHHASAYTFPSTNDQNRALNRPHVDLISSAIGQVSLRFINTTNSLAFFEIRKDGVSTGTSPHPVVVGDTIHTDGVGVDGRAQLKNPTRPNPDYNAAGYVDKTITASQKVEVRLALGGERNWDFNWTPFNVLSAPTASDSAFVGSPKYVRAGNYTVDIAAQIRVPNTATDIRFNVNGQTIYDNGAVINNDASVICNENNNFVVNTVHITSNGNTDDDIYAVNGAPAGSQWYRLQKNLSPGEYVVTAEFKIGCNWYPVTGSGVVYSLDAPTASYVSPTTGAIFRPSDNPVRVKVEDQFEQFSRMVVTIGANSFEVTRANCDQRAAGNYLLCDVNTSPTWTNLAEGTYSASTTTYTKANNRVDNLLSPSFVIDATRPGVTNLDLEYPTAAQAAAQVFGATVNASATASDNQGVESVNFYITAPRLSDGVCTGNGTKLAENRVTTTDVDGRWRVALASSALTGSYCLTAMARDNAANNSSPVTVPIQIDNTAPDAPTLLSPANNAVVTGEDLTNDWSDVAGAVHYIYQSYNVDSSGNCIMSPVRFTATYTASNTNTRDVADLSFCWRVKAVDAAGNESAWSELWKVTTDNTAPIVQITAPADGDLLRGEVTISGVVTDANPYRYYLVVKNSNGDVVAGPGTVYADTVADVSWNTALFADGTYTIRLEARDAAGNKNGLSVAVVSVTVDNTPPVITANDLTTTDGSPELTGALDDPSASLTVTVNGVDYSSEIVISGTDWTLPAGVIAPLLAVDDYIIDVVATDQAGNVGTTIALLSIEAATVTPPASTPANEPQTLGATTTNQTGTSKPASQSTTVQTGDNNTTTNAPQVAAATTDGEKQDANQDDQKVAAANIDAKNSRSWWWLIILLILAAVLGGYALFKKRGEEA